MGTWLVNLDSSRFIKSVTFIRRLLCIEWYGKLGFHKLSLILKFSVIIKILLIPALVSLRYLKAICDESEYMLINKIKKTKV